MGAAKIFGAIPDQEKTFQVACENLEGLYIQLPFAIGLNL